MSNLKKYIPRWLKLAIITLYVLTRCFLRGRPTKEIRLNLSEVLPPLSSKKIVHGGKIKLLHLRERFGDTWRNFNIAYFVSSGLPFAPAIWIRIYKFFGIKIVWNQNGVAYPALYTPEIVGRINNLYRPIRLSDYVVYQSEFCKRSADKYLGGYIGPSSVIYNPVDTNIFTPTLKPAEPLTLLVIGSHFTRERIILPIQALKELHDKGIKAKLIIAGRLLWPNAEEDVAREIKMQIVGNWVEQRGAFSQEKAPLIYQSAHILLHLKYLDPCPTVVLEAMACGLPVIASKSGGLPEMVDNKSGVLIPVIEDFEKLHYPTVAEITEAVIAINKRLPGFSKNAREQAISKFNKELWLKKHEEIFQKLCR